MKYKNSCLPGEAANLNGHNFLNFLQYKKGKFMKNKSIRTNGFFSLLLAFCLLLGSCKDMSKSQKGTYIGAAGGGAAGAAIGRAGGNTALGAILGAAIGGAAGYGIG